MSGRAALGRALLGGAAAAALLAAGGAAAQAPIRVRAGEHPDHTRIVIDGPPGGEYAWGVAGRRLTLRLALPGGAFDAGPARGAPGLSRVASIAAGEAAEGPTLAIELGCDCGAREMRLGDGRFVLDIAEGAPRPAPPASGAATPEAGPAREAAAMAAERVAPGAIGALAPRDGAPEAGTAGPVETVRPAPAAAPPPARRPAPRDTHAAPAGARGPDAATAPAAADAPVAGAAPEPETAARAGTAAEAAPAAAGEKAAAAEAGPPAAPPPPTAEAETVGEAEAGAPGAATIEAARQSLLKQLTRAAEEGLLELAPQASAPREAPAPEAEAETDEGPDPETDAPAAPAPLRARTGLELAGAPPGVDPKREPAPEPPGRCLPDARFDAALWSTAAPVALQLGARRRALVGEFDDPEPEAVIAYVQLLLRYGFGVEARAALEAFADRMNPPEHLLDMADILEGAAPDPEGPVRAGVGCGGAHGAWALAGAALGGDLDPDRIDVAALRPALAALPARLRTRVALPIAEAALEAGRIEAAEAVAGVAARAEPPPPDGDGFLTILLARIDAARGDWRRAEAMIEPMLASATLAGAEAMIRMVEFRLARGAAPPPGMAENMEAMAFSLGAAALGRRLLRAAAEARASGEGLGLALAALEDLARRGGDRAAATAAARDMLLDYAPAAEEGAAYAEAALAHDGLIGADAGGDRARVAVARRLTALGLGNLAEDMLAPALARDDPAARVAAAEAAVSTLEPDRAIALLEETPGPEAARARAAAHAARGDYAAAAEAAATAPDPALAARYAWLAGNWRAAMAAGDADRRMLAAWMAGEGAMPPELEAAAAEDPALAARMEAFAPRQAAEAEAASPIDAAAQALEASRRRREVMRELLSDG